MEGLQGSYWNYQTSSIPELKGPAEPGKEQEFLRMPLLCVYSSLQQDRKVSSCSEIPCHFWLSYSSFLPDMGTSSISHCWAHWTPMRTYKMLVEQPPNSLLGTNGDLWAASSSVVRETWAPGTQKPVFATHNRSTSRLHAWGGLWTPRTHPSGLIP